MTTKIIAYNQWYDTLVDELQDIITETEFTSRWTLIEGYHLVGERILKENDNFEREKIYGEKILQRLAKSIGKSERTLYYAVQFAKVYPDLNLLPEGKNINWWHVVNKYLTTGEKKVTIKKGDLYRMIKEIKELLEREWLLAHKEIIENGLVLGYQERCDFIRYLQDQVNKITEG